MGLGTCEYDIGSPAGTLKWSQLQYDCAMGNYAAILEVITRDPNFAATFESNNGFTRENYSTLHIAARYGEAQILQLFLRSGVRPSLVDTFGFTPLHYATMFQQLECVKVLLAYGADPHQLSHNKTSSLDFARSVGNFALLEVYQLQLQQLPLSCASGSSSVLSWLTRIGLEDYYEKFVTAGYDDLEFIATTGLAEEDLNAIGVNKLGHRKKLGGLYQLLPPATAKEEDESEEEEEDESEEEEDESEDEEESSSDEDED